jgi:protein-S-isoprenylcysteine O-methyltransferase Ste14
MQSDQFEHNCTTPVQAQPPTRFFYRYRGLLLAPPLLFALVCTWAETEIDLLVFPLGLSIFALGVALRFWAQCHLHYRLRVRKALTTSGPYHYVRNPIYIGNLLIVGGLCVVSELIWLVPAMLLWTVAVYRGTVRYEEYHLTQKYGVPYTEFLRRVPRWMPRLPLLPELLAPSVRPFFAASARAELHNLLILAPFLLKEFIA